MKVWSARRSVLLIRVTAFIGFIGAVLLLRFGIHQPIKLLLASQPLNLLVALRGRPDAVFLGAFFVIVVTAYGGRLTCGLLCPVGIAQDVVGLLRKKKTSDANRPSPRYLRFAFLVMFVSLLVGGIDVASVLEPYTFFARIGVVTTNRSPLASPGVSTSTTVPLSASVVLLGAVLVAAFFKRRAFCRLICPAGALLSLIALRARLRIRKKISCHDCALWERVCDAGALGSGCRVSTSDCYLCFDCVRACPDGALHYSGKARLLIPPTSIVPRRRFIGMLLGGIVTALFIRFLLWKQRRRVRPPSSGSDFTATCNRCLLCVSVCPNGVLKPSLDGGDFLLPFMDIGHMEDGKSYCEYECLECGKVCPVGAIRFGDVVEKWSNPLGLAVIDESKCMTYSAGYECLACEEVCPVVDKAVRVVRIRMNGEHLRAPKIDAEKCLGCGCCVFNCPEKAIGIIPY